MAAVAAVLRIKNETLNYALARISRLSPKHTQNFIAYSFVQDFVSWRKFADPSIFRL